MSITDTVTTTITQVTNRTDDAITNNNTDVIFSPNETSAKDLRYVNANGDTISGSLVVINDLDVSGIIRNNGTAVALATGNTATATKLETARTISLDGDASGSISFDGTANETLTVTVANDSHTHDSRYYTETESDARFLGISTKAVDSDLLDGQEGTFYQNASNLNAGTIDDARLPAVISSDITGNVTGNASTATKLETTRTITLDGDASGSISFDGTTNEVLTVTVADDSHTHDGRYYTETEVDTINTSTLGSALAFAIALG